MGVGDFTAYSKPDAVTGCNPPNVVVWISVDNKNAVSLTDAAAGKGNGGYVCSDVALAHGYKFLLDATTPEAANCKPPDVAVWFNRNENNYFVAGSDGYKQKTGSGSFVCLKDAIAIGGKDGSQGIIGMFSADKLNCNPDKPVYVPQGALTFLTLHDPQAPKSPVADGVGLWMCSNYANNHGRTLARAWKTESDAQCPGDVVVWAGQNNLYDKKGQPNYGQGLGYYTCLITAADLAMNPDGASAAPTGVPMLSVLDADCRKAGDILVYKYAGMGIALPLDDPSLDYTPAKLASTPSQPNYSVCAAQAKAQGWKVGYISFRTRAAATCTDDVYWIDRQTRQYYKPSDDGYGKGSGYYECSSTALSERLKAAFETPPPKMPTSAAACSNAVLGLNKNYLQLTLSNGVKCMYDLDTITIDQPSDTKNPYYGLGFAVHRGAAIDFFPSYGGIQFAFAYAFGQSITADLNNVMLRYNVLKSQQKH